jgi:protoheme IX farnesyltransferase
MKARAVPLPVATPLVASRIADYIELAKPRVLLLVLLTVAAGALLAARGTPDPIYVVHVLCGTALVAAGASALNQLFERQSDALMHRTERRPLPGGRLRPLEVGVLGIWLGVAGIAYLALTLPHLLAAGVAGAAFLGYAFVYTPLKSRTSLNTLVGAVPGALPPVIGWTAITGSIGPEIVSLFVILFFWQVPHFLAIAWMYRHDYARAGLEMLPVHDESGTRTGRQMVVYSLALVPASLAPAAIGLAGPVYLIGALLSGLVFLNCARNFACATSDARARRMLQASLIYLPALLALLVLDGRSSGVALALWH